MSEVIKQIDQVLHGDPGSRKLVISSKMYDMLAEAGYAVDIYERAPDQKVLDELAAKQRQADRRFAEYRGLSSPAAMKPLKLAKVLRQERLKAAQRKAFES